MRSISTATSASATGPGCSTWRARTGRPERCRSARAWLGTRRCRSRFRALTRRWRRRSGAAVGACGPEDLPQEAAVGDGLRRLAVAGGVPVRVDRPFEPYAFALVTRDEPRLHVRDAVAGSEGALDEVPAHLREVTALNGFELMRVVELRALAVHQQDDSRRRDARLAGQCSQEIVDRLARSAQPLRARIGRDVADARRSVARG